MFKKLLYFSFAVFIIIFMWTVNTQMKTLEESMKKEIYVNKSSSCGEIIIDDFSFFKKGESIVIYNYSLNEILSFYNANIVFMEESEFGKSYYCYSKELKYAKEINGKIINLHIFIDNEKIILGFPIIFGAY